jgi:hypothetical protein
MTWIGTEAAAEHHSFIITLSGVVRKMARFASDTLPMFR